MKIEIELGDKALRQIGQKQTQVIEEFEELCCELGGLWRKTLGCGYKTPHDLGRDVMEATNKTREKVAKLKGVE